MPQNHVSAQRLHSRQYNGGSWYLPVENQPCLATDIGTNLMTTAKRLDLVRLC